MRATTGRYIYKRSNNIRKPIIDTNNPDSYSNIQFRPINEYIDSTKKIGILITIKISYSGNIIIFVYQFYKDTYYTDSISMIGVINMCP